MAMQTFEARVKISGTVTRLRIDANNSSDARRILEAQYGKGSVLSLDTIRK